MRPKTIFYMLIVLVLLWIGYWALLQYEGSSKQAIIEAKQVFDFKADDIASVEIMMSDARPVLALRSDDGRWSIEKPYPTIKPNQNVWNRISNALETMVKERSIEESPQNLEMYGLSQPELKMRVKLKTVKELNINFGILDPTQSNRYTRVSTENNVFLVSHKTFAEFNRPLSELRFPYVFDVPEDGIQGIEFARYREDDDGTVYESTAVIFEKVDNIWRLVNPINVPANQEKVGALANELRFATGRGYVDEPESLSDYGLDPGGARISIIIGDGNKQTLYLGNLDMGDEEGGLFVKHETLPAVFKIYSHLLTLLPKSPHEFRESRLFVGDGTAIRRIHYKSGDADILFEKDAEKGWIMTRPSVSDTNEAAVSALISALKTIEGMDFPGPERLEHGLKDPVISIKLEIEGEDKPIDIKVGSALTGVREGYYYATQDDGTVVTIAEERVRMLSKRPFDFRKKELMPFDKRSAVRVALVFEEKNYQFEFSKGKWRVVKPQGVFLESQSDMAAILDVLSTLKAVGIESHEAHVKPGTYGFNKPTLIASVHVREGEDIKVIGSLQIGNVCEDESQQRFARMLGRNEVLRVKQAVIDGIRDALRGVR